MKENTKLEKLYTTLYEDLSTEIKKFNRRRENENRATSPLLLKANKEYLEADVRIMFFGQETNTWYGERSHLFSSKITPNLEAYSEFYLDGECYSYGGQFFNGVKRLKELLKKNLPNQEIGFMWNNVVKIGMCQKGCDDELNELTLEYFNVIKKEIDILKPDYLIFFSGPEYDQIIENIFGIYEQKKFRNFDLRELCELTLKDMPRAFRTYHPNYLFRNDINRFFNPIINQITKDCKVKANEPK